MPIGRPSSVCRVCAYSSARSASRTMYTASRASSGLLSFFREAETTRRRSRPSTYSCAMKYSSPTFPKSKTGMMLEWTRLDASLASSMNISTRDSVRCALECSSLITNARRKFSAPKATAV